VNLLLGISVMVQEKLHHPCRPRGMNGTLARRVEFIVSDEVVVVF
jgi:hypothetical protein